MPSKKKKYNSRFPPARIKKIMQTDEEIGKVAAAVPVLISKCVEMFLVSILENTGSVTNARKAKTMTTSHLKECIMKEKTYDFLRELVENEPDCEPSTEENDGSAVLQSNKEKVPRKRAASSSRPQSKRVKEELRLKTDSKTETPPSGFSPCLPSSSGYHQRSLSCADIKSPPISDSKQFSQFNCKTKKVEETQIKPYLRLQDGSRVKVKENDEENDDDDDDDDDNGLHVDESSTLEEVRPTPLLRRQAFSFVGSNEGGKMTRDIAIDLTVRKSKSFEEKDSSNVTADTIQFSTTTKTLPSNNGTSPLSSEMSQLMYKSSSNDPVLSATASASSKRDIPISGGYCELPAFSAYDGQANSASMTAATSSFLSAPPGLVGISNNKPIIAAPPMRRLIEDEDDDYDV